MNDPSRWMLDDLPVGVWVARVPEGEAVYANKAFQEILGMAPVAGSKIGDAPATYCIRDREGQPYPVEKLPFSRVVAGGGSVTVDDIVLHRPDGKRVPIRAFGQPVHDQSGRLTHVIVAFLDVTIEMKEREQRAVLEDALQLIVDHAPLAYFCVDRKGVITFSRGAGLKRLGVVSGELVGKNVFELYAQHPTISNYIRRGLAGESLWYTVTVGDVTFDSWLTPLRDAEGEIVGAAGVSNDVTEIRSLQTAAIQSDRVMAMGTLAASVAHEINNPLTYIRTSLDQLEEGLARLGPAGFGLQQFLEPVRHGFERITTVTRELRTFSRPDDQRSEPIDVRRVISAVLTLMRKEIETRARLEVSLDENAVVLGNEARLGQVVTNLTMNALQAQPEQSDRPHEISIASRREGDRVVIEVGDRGPGVPAVDRQRIFEPFVTTKPIGVGTGLGLFVCRNIVRDLGGEITVGDRPGGGALFRVVLPAVLEVSNASVSRPAQAADAGVRWRVLVIDDDPAVARSFASCLETAGVEVETAIGGRQALDRLLAGARFDLVYCDLMMRGMTGMDVAEELAKAGADLLANLVFMTGGAFTARAAAFAGEHVDRIVEKPFDIIADVRARLGGPSS